MTSPLLALFTRSLREDARGKATYWARGGLGAFLLCMLASFANQWNGAPGLAFFSLVITLQMLAITFVGLSYFASAVTEEKENETLGLLRMTDLNPLSILLGKSTSRLCGALLLLVGQIPFTIFAITLGGVSLAQIAAVYCTVGAFTFLLCNLALLGSVLARRTAGAAVFSVVVLAFFLGIGPLLGWIKSGMTRFVGVQAALGHASDVLWSATPIARLWNVLTATSFSGAPVGWQVGANLVLGVACFLLAWAAFERFCDRAPEAAATTGGPLRFPRWWWARPPRVGKRALLWKDFHFLCGGRRGLAIRVLGYGGGLITFIALLWNFQEGYVQFVDFALSFAFSLEVALLAARLFRTELRDQTMAALATLPVSIRQIAYRKALACGLVAIPGALATGVTQLLRSSGNTDPIMLEMAENAVGLVLLAHVVAVLSLYMKRGAFAVGYVVTQAGCLLIMSICGFVVSHWGGWSSFTFDAAIVIMVTSMVASPILHWHGLRRLATLAGED